MDWGLPCRTGKRQHMQTFSHVSAPSLWGECCETTPVSSEVRMLVCVTVTEESRNQKVSSEVDWMRREFWLFSFLKKYGGCEGQNTTVLQKTQSHLTKHNNISQNTTFNRKKEIFHNGISQNMLLCSMKCCHVSCNVSVFCNAVVFYPSGPPHTNYAIK